MELSQIVPWGRSYQEYRDMFLLTDKDRARTILGCGDGPASFNAELSRAGGSVVSVDPIYRFGKEKIRQRIVEAYPQVLAQLSLNFSDYLWTKLGGVEELGRLRMQAMELFLADYEAGKKTGRYLAASLPALPFTDKAFDLALCSHYLFLYSAHIGLEQHAASVLELCRVAREVRIYPLVDLDGRRSRHLGPVQALLEESGMEVRLVPVDYRFQKGATEMLVTG